jgi:hypothetical protein
MRRVKVEKGFCANIKNEKTRAVLQKSVERVIKENQKVFDKLAKS